MLLLYLAFLQICGCVGKDLIDDFPASDPRCVESLPASQAPRSWVFHVSSSAAPAPGQNKLHVKMKMSSGMKIA